MRLNYLTPFIFVLFALSAHSQTNECQKVADDRVSGVEYLNYTEVKACYESNPFNQTNANEYAVEDLIAEMRDGHTAFSTTNYSLVFYQEFSMYSVIKPDGTQ
ncbi:37859_t:CDS:2, partial [Gigaspora margarita]